MTQGLLRRKRYEAFPATVKIFSTDHPWVGPSVYVKAGVCGVPWFIPAIGDPLRPGHDPAGAGAAMIELMGELMSGFDELPRVRRGPVPSLYAALRRRAPQVAAARPDDEALLHVSYRGQEAQVAWDDDLEQYAWRRGGSGQIGSDAEKAAELIAWALGARTGPATSG